MSAQTGQGWNGERRRGWTAAGVSRRIGASGLTNSEGTDKSDQGSLKEHVDRSMVSGRAANLRAAGSRHAVGKGR